MFSACLLQKLLNISFDSFVMARDLEIPVLVGTDWNYLMTEYFKVHLLTTKICKNKSLLKIIYFCVSKYNETGQVILGIVAYAYKVLILCVLGVCKCILL